jgi:dCMP deaminase
MTARPDWDDYFLGIATAVAARADCTRSKVGAVIVKDNQIIQPGYNGAPPGMPGCLTDGACPRGRQGYAELPRTENYDTGAHACIAVHAEANAIIRAGRDRCIGATIYVTRKPCDGCFRLILAASIERVIWPGMPPELRH